jgi:hypothetical protein
MIKTISITICHSIYLTLTLIGGVVLWFDCINEPSILPPGDSFMFFYALNILGGFIWLLAWLSTSWYTFKRLPGLRRGDVLFILLTLALLSILSVKLKSINPDWESGLLWSIILYILPGLRGGLSAISLVNQYSLLGNKRFGRALIIVGGTAAFTTYLWWPREVILAIVSLVNVRGYPLGWTYHALLKQILIAGTFGIVTLIFSIIFLHSMLNIKSYQKTGFT